MDPVFPSTIRIAHTTTLSAERDKDMEDMEGTMRVRISPEENERWMRVSRSPSITNKAKRPDPKMEIEKREKRDKHIRDPWSVLSY